MVVVELVVVMAAAMMMMMMAIISARACPFLVSLAFSLQSTYNGVDRRLHRHAHDEKEQMIMIMMVVMILTTTTVMMFSYVNSDLSSQYRLGGQLVKLLRERET